MPSGAEPVQGGTGAPPEALPPDAAAAPAAPAALAASAPAASAPAASALAPASPAPAPASPAPAPASPAPASDAAAPPRERRLSGGYADPFIWATSLAVLGAYLVISLSRLIQLNPSSWDLSIYTEYVKQAASFLVPVADIRTPGFNLLGDHFQPIVMVIAPFFRAFPSAATLLAAQALLAALSVVAVARAAREKLGVGPSRAIAVAYGFSWGLQQMASFDFHEIAFAVPLLAFSLSALIRGQLKATVGWALPLVLVKEDQGFTVAAIGLYLVLAGLRAGRAPAAAGTTLALSDPGGSRRIRAGQFLLIWGFAWSFLAIGVIIPHFNPAHQYDYWSDGGILAPGGHPTVTGLIGQLFHAWPDKLQTVVMLLLPTAFVALRSPLLLVAGPSLLLRFLSTDSSYWGTYWHYNATVMPVIFLAAIDATARIGAAMAAEGPAGSARWAGGGQGARRAILAGARRYGAAMMLAIAVPLAFQFPLSTVWNAQSYRVSSHVRSADAAMARVPDGATVQATLDLLAPLAARTDAFWIGNSGNPRTQYIVFDGPDSGYSPAISNVPAFIAQLYHGHRYAEIFHSGGVYVFRRTP